MCNKLDKYAIKKMKEEMKNNKDTEINQNQDNTNYVLNKILKKKKEEKYRTSVYLKKDVFEKIITLNAETNESFTDIIETILEETLKDVVVKQRYVTAYKENLKKKQNKKDV